MSQMLGRRDGWSWLDARAETWQERDETERPPVDVGPELVAGALVYELRAPLAPIPKAEAA
jgi:hypothetical protein